MAEEHLITPDRTPLLSVVIPTAGRRHWLGRAVESALASAPDGNVEVIVVPNGVDDSWTTTLAPFARDSRVRAEPIATAHANVARNHGLQCARGDYIRFLDDDDYLIPDGAVRQLEGLQATQADISSGAVNFADSNDNVYRIRRQPDCDDFVEAIISPEHLTLPCAHVFKRSVVAYMHWDESVAVGQDTHWLFDLCMAGDFSWTRTDDVVGTWCHHAEHRTSASVIPERHYWISATLALKTHDALSRQSRLTTRREATLSEALWFSVHGAFFLHPWYWARIALQARRHFPGTYPDLAIYRSRLGRMLHPLALETLMIPKRWANYIKRKRELRRGAIQQW